MHYYTFNIGDYRKDTVHLTRLEHSIYRDLIDWYYLDEKPIPAETESVTRRLRLESEEEARALKNVLNDFFVLQEDGWHQARVDLEIQKYHTQCEKNRLNGAAGGRPRKDKNPVGSQSQPSRNPNQEPITNNQEPITSIKNTTRRSAVIVRPEEVDETIWNDFLSIRKAKRSPLTQTALESISREAMKAGWGLNAALRECVSRGWQGFKADWVAEKRSHNLNKQEALEARNRAVVERLIEKDRANGII